MTDLSWLATEVEMAEAEFEKAQRQFAQLQAAVPATAQQCIRQEERLKTLQEVRARLTKQEASIPDNGDGENT